ncbi:MAG TPA: hypothetical protein P5150_09970 [Candidatus Ratteibacteria bacterium]|nr:hypothetical protein [Candidatus Ratteibacteria bacterium]
MKVFYSNRAYRFIKEQKIEEKVRQLIRKFILKYTGEDININVKKLKGKWINYHRIKSGTIRIILRVDKDNNCIFVDTVDFRGNIY